MNSLLLKIYEQEYLKLELFSVTQKNREFFISKIDHRDLLKIYTVEPTKYDLELYGELADTSSHLAQYYEMVVQKDDDEIDTKGFQRTEDEERVKEIKTFLTNDIFPVFPNTIIVTCDLGVDISDVENDVPVEKYINRETSGKLSFIEKREDKLFIYIPYSSNSLVIVDGQHRLAGLREAKLTDKYELILSFVIGYDRTYIANLFYTINYYQKKVNKSVLLHLQSEFSRKLDEVTFMHGIVRILNEHRQSPLNGRIKMLGVTPKDIAEEDKVKYGVSQAFLIDYMLPLIGKEPSRSLYQPVFYYYYKNDEYYGDLVKFILMYFNAIKRHTKNYWENPKDSIVTKTISIGAFIKILHILFLEMFVVEWRCDPSKIREVSTDCLEERLRGIGNVDFSKAGDFGGVSSSGTLGKLQKHLVSKMDYFGNKDYEQVVENIKHKDLVVYKDWYARSLEKMSNIK